MPKKDIKPIIHQKSEEIDNVKIIKENSSSRKRRSNAFQPLNKINSRYLY